MGPNEVLDKGFVADGPVTKYRAVVLTDTENVAQASAAGAQVLGIFQEEFDQTDADNGRVGRVRVMGISRGVAAGAIAINDRLVVDANGRLTPAAPAAGANANVVGVALTAAAAVDEWIDVMLTPGASLQG